MIRCPSPGTCVARCPISTTRKCRWWGGRTFARRRRPRSNKSSRWCWRAGWRSGLAVPATPQWARCGQPARRNSSSGTSSPAARLCSNWAGSTKPCIPTRRMRSWTSSRSVVASRSEAREKELILCNLLARRQAMLELGGFNEALYPNEENALMDELQERGGKLIYDPQLVVHRRPRSSLKSFAWMLMTYGRGRAEQFRVHPTLGSALNFVPPLFCLYLLALVFLLALTPIARVCLVPLAFYALAVLAQAVVLAAGGRVLQSLAAIPPIVLTHILYGVGFWRGLVTPLRPPGQHPPGQVLLETVLR